MRKDTDASTTYFPAAVEYLMWPRKKSQEPKTKETAFGTFVNKNGMWEGYVESEDDELRVVVNDLNGEPNPWVLGFIPYITSNLPALEQDARNAVSKLTTQHVLSSISNDDANDFALNFDYAEEHWSETVCVGFKEGKVTDWWSAD